MKKAISVIILISLIGILFSCAAQSSSATTLAGVEVKQYQGKNLSSMNDIIDNAIIGTQKIDVNTYHLEISGMVNTPQQLTYDQVLSLNHYKKVVTLNCVEGWSADILWEGVLLKDVLDKAGIQSGANTVLFTCSDGYTTSLPLDYIVNNQIILASKMNDVVIPQAKGFPFMVVAQDKLGYKWAKWITKIDLTNDPNYQGYWESRGYSNDGNVQPS